MAMDGGTDRELRGTGCHAHGGRDRLVSTAMCRAILSISCAVLGACERGQRFWQRSANQSAGDVYAMRVYWMEIWRLIEAGGRSRGCRREPERRVTNNAFVCR